MIEWPGLDDPRWVKNPSNRSRGTIKYCDGPLTTVLTHLLFQPNEYTRTEVVNGAGLGRTIREDIYPPGIDIPGLIVCSLTREEPGLRRELTVNSRGYVWTHYLELRGDSYRGVTAGYDPTEGISNLKIFHALPGMLGEYSLYLNLAGLPGRLNYSVSENKISTGISYDKLLEMLQRGPVRTGISFARAEITSGNGVLGEELTVLGNLGLLLEQDGNLLTVTSRKLRSEVSSPPALIVRIDNAVTNPGALLSLACNSEYPEWERIIKSVPLEVFEGNNPSPLRI